MGNSIEGGFSRVPALYLRELRWKTDSRYRTAVAKRKRAELADQQKNNLSNGSGQTNVHSVTEFIISNPDFLDDFVSSHIAQDRVRAWIRGPSGDSEDKIDSAGDKAMADSAVSFNEKSLNAEKSPGMDAKESAEEAKEDAKEAKEDAKEAKEGANESIKERESDKEQAKDTADPDQITPEAAGSSKLLKKAKSCRSVKETKGGKLLRLIRGEPSEEKTKSSTEEGDGKISKRAFTKEENEKHFRQKRLLILNSRRLLYPFKYKNEELSELIDRPVTEPYPEIDSYFFPYTEIRSDEINKVFIQMSTNLLGKHAFPAGELLYFLTTLKANYHNVEYHNYSHALSHAQSMYWILKSNPGVFTELEMKSLLIASIAHDVGHPGVDESYLRKVSSSMEVMYDSPVLESHHTQTCFLILQDLRCNVFCNLDVDDYHQVLEDMRHAIISTHVDRYKMQCERCRHLVEAGMDLNKRYVRNSVKSLMMMACDLCAMWKRWEEHKNIVWSLYKEFFNQSDKEMNFGLSSPPYRMRMNADAIPQYQVSFMEGIAMPIFRLLSDIFPTLRDINETATKNLECWKTY